MFYLIAVDLTVLWLVALFTSHTIGGIINILPVFAIIIVFLNIINERHIVRSANTNKIVGNG
jgi:hypothetical protein